MSSSVAQCCDKVYFCPTSGETECPVHGGFDVCCDRPDLHRPDMTAANTSSGRAKLCPECGGSTLHIEMRDVFEIDPANPPPPTHYGMWVVCQGCGHEFEGERDDLR